MGANREKAVPRTGATCHPIAASNVLLFLYWQRFGVKSIAMATGNQDGVHRFYADGDPVFVAAVVSADGPRGAGPCCAGDYVRVRIGSARRQTTLWIPIESLRDRLPLVGDSILELVVLEGLLRLHIRRRSLQGEWESAWIPLGTLRTGERIDPMLLREGTEE